MRERIDHVAEARKVATRIENSAYIDREQYLAEAQLHATLALVELQRIANLIAMWDRDLLASDPEIDAVENEIREALGLDDG